MKRIVTLKPVRYNGEDKPAGDVFYIEDDLYSLWIDLGLAKDYIKEPENKPEGHNETENNLNTEDSIKPTEKKGQVKKNAKKGW